EAASVALGAGGISTIAAQEHADMELVFLALEVVEESAHAEEFAFAVENEIAVLFGEIDPRHIERNSGSLGVTLQVGEQRTILGFGPRLDCAIAQRLQFVGN